MKQSLEERLSLVLPKLVSPEFLSGKGLGNEIGFHIFDYPPEEELRIREFVANLIDQIPLKRPGTKVSHINLFDFVVEYLRERNLLERALDMQQAKGDDALVKAMTGPLHESKLSPIFAEKARLGENDLVLLTGVGSAFPMLRSHTLLNNLQTVMGRKPFVIFYPGKYDQQSLRLFGKVKSANYYRAFSLIG
jgi:hypothetical protein